MNTLSLTLLLSMACAALHSLNERLKTEGMLQQYKFRDKVNNDAYGDLQKERDRLKEELDSLKEK